MHKSMEIFFVLLFLILFYVLLPLESLKSQTSFYDSVQSEYELEYLAWSAKNFRELHPSVCKDAVFECYDKNGILVNTYEGSLFKASYYRYIVIIKNGQRRGVFLD